MKESHRVMDKNFDAEMFVNGNKLPLNNFVQETLGNIMLGITKTLKGLDESTPNVIELKIKRLSSPKSVDAHVYPVQ